MNHIIIKNTQWIYIPLGIIFSTCLFLALYIEPITDDYCFAYYIHESENLWANVAKDWLQVNGRWATSGMRYLFMTYIGVENNYWLTIPFSLCSLFLACWFAAGTIVVDSRNRLFFASISSLVFLSVASTMSDLIFWGTGFTDYTIGYLLATLCCYCAYQLARSNDYFSIKNYLLLSCSTIIVCGIAELFLMPIWAFLSLSFLLGKNKIKFLPILILMVIATGMNILAPGNEVRSTRVVESLGALDFAKEAIIYGLRGLILPMLGMYFISHIPVIKEFFTQLASSIEQSFSRLIVSLVSIFALTYPFLVIIVLLFALGAPGPGRAHNLSLFVIIITWPIIITRFKFLRPKSFKKTVFNFVFTALGVIILLGQNNKDLIEDIVLNKAKNFHEEMVQVKTILSDKANQQQHVTLDAKNKTPSISSGLGYLVTEDKNYWVNQCVAYYFDLKSIDAFPVKH